MEPSGRDAPSKLAFTPTSPAALAADLATSAGPAAAVWFQLAALVDHTGRATFALDELADSMKIPRRSLQRYVDQLTDLSIVEKCSGRGKKITLDLLRRSDPTRQNFVCYVKQDVLPLDHHHPGTAAAPETSSSRSFSNDRAYRAASHIGDASNAVRESIRAC